jgi:general secretion pathway protein I
VRSSSARRASGFSLVEVLFALAVAGLALGATASAFRNGLMGHAAAGDVDTALALAQEKLAGAGISEKLQPGETRGAFGRFRWQLDIAPYRDPDGDAAAAPLRLYRVEAAVTWRDGGRERHFALSTLRLGAATPP